MIFDSDETAWIFGHGTQDVIMGCENCGRRVESAHASTSASDRLLCDKCHCLWMDGYYTAWSQSGRRTLR